MKGVFIPDITVEDLRNASLDGIEEFFSRILDGDEEVTIFDAELPEWIPVKAHPATEEERESRPDIDYWFDCKMPDDEQGILVAVKHKNWIDVEKDICYVEDSYGLDSGYDWLDDVIAWMPLPEPYREEDD